MQLLTFIQESCTRRHHGPKPNQRGVEPEAAERHTRDQLEEGVYAWMRIKVEATVFFFILERPSYCQCGVVLRGQEDRPRAGHLTLVLSVIPSSCITILAYKSLGRHLIVG